MERKNRVGGLRQFERTGKFCMTGSIEYEEKTKETEKVSDHNQTLLSMLRHLEGQGEVTRRI